VLELQAAATADRDAVGAKQRVKANKVIEHMEADPGSRLLCKALVFVRPLQRLLSTIFKAESMTTDFTHTASLAAREPDQLRDPIVAEKLTKAASHARPILSGAAGRQAPQDYSELLQDFGHAG
jgi:hypothetical protein